MVTEEFRDEAGNYQAEKLFRPAEHRICAWPKIGDDFSAGEGLVFATGAAHRESLCSRSVLRAEMLVLRVLLRGVVRRDDEPLCGRAGSGNGVGGE